MDTSRQLCFRQQATVVAPRRRRSFTGLLLVTLCGFGAAMGTLSEQLELGPLGTSLFAGEFNEVLSIGAAAPAWTNLPGTDGQHHSLSDLKDRKVVVVVFTCASCPTAVDYETRIDALAQRAAKSGTELAVVAISVNQVQEDRLEALKKRAADKRFSFVYLVDETQQIAREYGAIFTPEFFVLNADRKVVYMGAMDDSTDATKVQADYVDAAITAALSGKTPTKTETIARGCRIRYARVR